jgi:hypothetical protein
MQGLLWPELRSFDLPEASSVQRAILEPIIISHWVTNTKSVRTSKAQLEMQMNVGELYPLPKRLLERRSRGVGTEVLSWHADHGLSICYWFQS